MIAHNPVALTNGTQTVVFDLAHAAPRLVAWLDADVAHVGDPAASLAALEPPVPLAGLDELGPATILAEAGAGFPLRPGIEGHRGDGSGWAPRMASVSVEVDNRRLIAEATDAQARLDQSVVVELDDASVLTLQASLTNRGDDDYIVQGLTLTVPLAGACRELMRLGGRWIDEFRPERVAFDQGAIEVANRAGRTSHDRHPSLFVGTPGFSEEQGEVWAAHLGHSGNTRLRVEALSDGRRVLQAGELLLPGEIVLAPGEVYTTPILYLTVSHHGLNGVSDRFHRHLRARRSHPTSPRPVLLNTWEAVYFDHDLETLTALADRAAKIGVERFVLDDGWFRHRRDDTAGLGDWYVDESVWPDGLGPLADHVTDLGMEFGLWFEPEMVNPNSDLYRAHPEWALVPVSESDAEPVLARNQLVLDLVNDEVWAYLHERITTILDEYPISYVKWDMNRNLVAPTHQGRSTVHRQVAAVYRLLDALRRSHPSVEIESCSSGGGRADFAMLARTDRVWTSDCNDPLDRHRIQRGFSYLFPPELMGAHIGPPRAHTTGRTHSLAFRAATALFGHLGIEWNVLSADDDECAALARVIAEHKRLRPLLHGGRVVRIDHPDPAITANAVIAHDRDHAVVLAAQIETAASLAVAPLRVPGLDHRRTYQVDVVTLVDEPLGKARTQPAWVASGVRLTGAQLANGLQLPIMNPESALLVELRST